MKRTLIAILLLALLAAGGVTLAAGTPTLSRYVIAGGGSAVTVGDYTLRGTLGQPVTGQVSNGTYQLCAGFWCGLAHYEVFLPLVLRG